MAQRGERRAARASQHLEARAHESPERRHRRGGEGIERLFEDDLAVHAVARHALACTALVILWVLWELVRSCFAGDRDDREKQD